MEKESIDPANQFCPQALFLYGTYKVENKGMALEANI